jgi:hypothetical protein
VESAPQAYGLEASNAAPPFSTSAGTSPAVPVEVFVAYVAPGYSPRDIMINFLSTILLGEFLQFPLTVAVSEICLGLKPTVQRTYRRTFKAPGRVFGTYVLANLLILVASLALIIPGLIVNVLYVFVAPVVILEHLGGKAALSRSRQLGRGYYLRNTGIFIILFFIFFLLSFPLVVSLPAALAILGIPTKFGDFFTSLLADLFSYPITTISFVLLYYDMRVRKEGYGAPQLVEDLNY